MTAQTDLAKLEISKNLLQMNFMKRTLIAKEKSSRPKAVAFTSVVDINFPLKSSIVKKLNRQHEIISKWPVVHHLSGINGTPFPGFRRSFGGFNHYFENIDSVQPPPDSRHTDTEKCVNQSTSKHQLKHKRKSLGTSSNILIPLFHHLVQHKGPPAKKAKKKNSL